MKRAKATKSKDKPWHWPFQRISDGPEYSCPHGIGHSYGIHGCDGCCASKSFPKEPKCQTKKS